MLSDGSGLTGYLLHKTFVYLLFSSLLQEYLHFQRQHPLQHRVAEPAVEDVTDDGELIAVIAAAIAASEGKTSTDGFVVRSIRKVNRRKR